MNAGALRAEARRWLAAARPAVVVEVAATRGSVPREAGTRMLVAADAVLGTIGGGHLEWQAIAEARARLGRRSTRGDEAPHEQRLALGPSLGQCCGGDVRLVYAPLDAAALAAWPKAAPDFHLELHGAGHVGRAIVALLAGLDCRVRWIDEREAEFARLAVEGLPPHIEPLCVDAAEAEVAHAPPGACHLVLTHEHALDLRIAEAILKRGDFRWCGLIGSATKRARFEHRLEARGLPRAAIERLVCPIGVSGIAGKAPEAIAIAVVAQLLQATGGGA
ncbi:MAG TPA: xanthine dehydrogenase accessory protein XdhC [Methylibium sp.]|uniref:xanthine dehydrogenase accessory protein XdhC n=1 Tax=Methylibium sp. TaxID=2067992 RepID=UPI002DBC6446|nr:xanthine dehydrogenase accessory protein XdhC [Methylibium sp.]HEU4460679.1 xanthine dehydrogenase accessory protein XdhC [Methylibium sp.]